MNHNTGVSMRRWTERAPSGRRLARRAAAACVAGVLVLMGCTGDFHLTAAELSFSPNPAVPGDQVQAAFLLSLIPAQRHTIVLYINDQEHFRVTENGAPSIPVTLELGDAADLIAEYGTGSHTAYVLVEADGERARTQTVAFTLNAPAAGGAP